MKRAAAWGWLLLSGLTLAACALPPADSERVVIPSRSYGFVDELGEPAAGRAQRVGAAFFVPPEDAPPYPAVVILHSSIGQGTQDWHYASELTARGFAVLAVDSFTARGVEKTVRDQTLVSTASMLADAYAGLAWLAAEPRVDENRIAVLGFSKGGMAALYAGLASLRARIAPGSPAFAAHVAYYPWCGVRFLDARTTGAPILIHLGALDEVARPELCRDFVADIHRADRAAEVTLSVHRGARHAFDHPLLEWFGDVPVSGSPPVGCRIEEVAPGRFRETTSGRPATAETLPKLVESCGRDDLRAGGNPEAAAQALAQTIDFLKSSLADPGNGAGHRSVAGDDI